MWEHENEDVSARANENASGAPEYENVGEKTVGYESWSVHASVIVLDFDGSDHEGASEDETRCH